MVSIEADCMGELNTHYHNPLRITSEHASATTLTASSALEYNPSHTHMNNVPQIILAAVLSSSKRENMTRAVVVESGLHIYSYLYFVKRQTINNAKNARIKVDTPNSWPGTTIVKLVYFVLQPCGWTSGVVKLIYAY